MCSESFMFFSILLVTLPSSPARDPAPDASSASAHSKLSACTRARSGTHAPSSPHTERLPSPVRPRPYAQRRTAEIRSREHPSLFERLLEEIDDQRLAQLNRFPLFFQRGMSRHHTKSGYHIAECLSVLGTHFLSKLAEQAEFYIQFF